MKKKNRQIVCVSLIQIQNSIHLHRSFGSAQIKTVFNQLHYSEIFQLNNHEISNVFNTIVANDLDYRRAMSTSGVHSKISLQKLHK